MRTPVGCFEDFGRGDGEGRPHLINFQVVPTHRLFVQSPETQSLWFEQAPQLRVKHLRKNRRLFEGTHFRW